MTPWSVNEIDEFLPRRAEYFQSPVILLVLNNSYAVAFGSGALSPRWPIRVGIPVDSPE
jgi:hypothetical protein